MSRQIIAKDNDLKIISKIFEFLAEGHDIERRRTLLEMKDADGRTFRYVSIKDSPNESKRWGDGKVEVRRIDEVFKRMFDKGTPRTNPYAYLEDDEEEKEEGKGEGEGEGEEEGEEEGSNPKKKCAPPQEIEVQREAYAGEEAPSQPWSSARRTKP